MKTLRTSLSRILRGWHPSWFMAFFMLFVAAAMEISQMLNSAAVAALASTSLSRVGQTLFANPELSVSYVFIKFMLVIFALIILRTKPSPAWSFGLSFPLIVYGGYAFRYLLEAGLPDLSIPVLMIGGYLATALLSGVSSLLVASEQERIQCVEHYERLYKDQQRDYNALKMEISHAAGTDARHP